MHSQSVKPGLLQIPCASLPRCSRGKSRKPSHKKKKAKRGTVEQAVNVARGNTGTAENKSILGILQHRKVGTSPTSHTKKSQAGERIGANRAGAHSPPRTLLHPHTRTHKWTQRRVHTCSGRDASGHGRITAETPPPSTSTRFHFFLLLPPCSISPTKRLGSGQGPKRALSTRSLRPPPPSWAGQSVS